MALRCCHAHLITPNGSPFNVPPRLRQLEGITKDCTAAQARCRNTYIRTEYSGAAAQSASWAYSVPVRGKLCSSSLWALSGHLIFSLSPELICHASWRARTLLVKAYCLVPSRFFSLSASMTFCTYVLMAVSTFSGAVVLRVPVQTTSFLARSLRVASDVYSSYR